MKSSFAEIVAGHLNTALELLRDANANIDNPGAIVTLLFKIDQYLVRIETICDVATMLGDITSATIADALDAVKALRTFTDETRDNAMYHVPQYSINAGTST
jgi:hypothetical protein